MNYKFFNKIILFVVLLICSVAILCSCVDNEVSPEKTPAYSQTAAPTATPDIVDTTAEYCVSVKDYYGKPFSGGVVVSYVNFILLNAFACELLLYSDVLRCVIMQKDGRISAFR